jgi:hypothetical protein
MAVRPQDTLVRFIGRHPVGRHKGKNLIYAGKVDRGFPRRSAEDLSRHFAFCSISGTVSTKRIEFNASQTGTIERCYSLSTDKMCQTTF